VSRSDQTLDGLCFSLAGPGRVGESLASWLVARGARLLQVAGRRREGRASEVVRRLGGRALAVSDLASAGEGLLLLAVPDPDLAATARLLAGCRQAAVALHTSGSQPARVLAPLGAGGTAVGSFHPLKAFPRVLPGTEAANGAVFGIDGDPAARHLAVRLAGALGASTVEIPEGDRRLYHLAASLAAGGVVTLVATASGIARDLRLPPAVGRGYLDLARSALAEAAGLDEAGAALTGPVARGDASTLLPALGELARLDSEALAVAVALCRETLRQLGRLAPLTSDQAALAERLAAREGALIP
jgi:predicted short-subunit dehydrogenase-like oxidoreductase (DUF2520 family)